MHISWLPTVSTVSSLMILGLAGATEVFCWRLGTLVFCGFIMTGDWHVLACVGLDDGVWEFIQTNAIPLRPKPAANTPALLSEIGCSDGATGEEPANTLACDRAISTVGGATQEEPWPCKREAVSL